MFSPLAVDISNHFIYVVDYTLEGNSKHEIKFWDWWFAEWLVINPTMKMAVTVNCKDEKILVGLPSTNTIHLFTVNKTSNRLHHFGSKTMIDSSSEMIGYR